MSQEHTQVSLVCLLFCEVFYTDLSPVSTVVAKLNQAFPNPPERLPIGTNQACKMRHGQPI